MWLPPFTHTQAPAAGVASPASSYWATVIVTLVPGAGVRSLAVMPSVGSVAPVSGSKVVQYTSTWLRRVTVTPPSP